MSSELRKYVKEVLLEQGFFTYGSIGDLRSIFIEPFADLAKVVKGAIQDVSNKGKLVAGVLWDASIASINVFVNAKFDDRFEEEKKRERELHEKYDDVFDRVTSKMVESGDFHALSFLLNPSAYLAVTTISPAISFDILRSLTLHDKRAKNKLSQSYASFIESKLILSEKIDRNSFLSLLKDDDVQRALQSSSIILSMRKDAQKFIDDVSSDLERDVESIKEVMRIESIDELSSLFDREGIVGNKEKLRKVINDLKSLEEGERKRIESTMIESAKKQMRDVTLLALTEKLKITLDATLKRLYQKTIDEISAIR